MAGVTGIYILAGTSKGAGSAAVLGVVAKELSHFLPRRLGRLLAGGGDADVSGDLNDFPGIIFRAKSKT